MVNKWIEKIIPENFYDTKVRPRLSFSRPSSTVTGHHHRQSHNRTNSILLESSKGKKLKLRIRTTKEIPSVCCLKNPND